MDGEITISFTVPCTYQMVENKNYVDTLYDIFFGIKSHIGQIKKIAVQ